MEREQREGVGEGGKGRKEGEREGEREEGKRTGLEGGRGREERMNSWRDSMYTVHYNMMYI